MSMKKHPKTPIRIVDSHVHLDLISAAEPDRPEWLATNGCLPISWSYCISVESRDDLAKFLERKAAFIREMNAKGLRCYYLAGIHPRNIPPDLDPEQIRELILPHLDDANCLGVGEIGLEAVNAREREVLEAHLALHPEVRDRNKRFGIHTPASDKMAVTGQILSVLSGFPRIKSITVVDHCMPETIGLVLTSGYWAGVTVSPVKASPDDLARIVDEQPFNLDKIMCNSDSGTEVHDDLFWLSESDHFSDELVEKLTLRNAARFFNIPV